jgi:hypothetical protein
MAIQNNTNIGNPNVTTTQGLEKEQTSLSNQTETNMTSGAASAATNQTNQSGSPLEKLGEMFKGLFGGK